jgi:hypothetical protein
VRLSGAAVARDAWALWRRERGLLLSLAGPFWFLPAYAMALLTPVAPVVPDGATDQTRATLLAPWLQAVGPWWLLDVALGLWGATSVYALLLDGARPTVGAAIGRGLRAWPRVVLAGLALAAAALPVAAVAGGLLGGVGLVLWLLIAVYAMARLLPLGPALTAERRLAALPAIARAARLTRGAGLPLAGLLAGTTGAGLVVQEPLLALDSWLRAASGGANVVAVAVVDAGAATAATGVALASALLAVAAYRLASSGT